MEILEKAVTIAADDPVMYEHLGDIYLKKLRKNDAREAWLKSLEIDPKNDKLKAKYKESGFGDPDKEDRIKSKIKQLEEKEKSKKKKILLKVWSKKDAPYSISGKRW